MSSNYLILSIVIPIICYTAGYYFGRYFAIIRRKTLDSFPSARKIPDIFTELDTPHDAHSFNVISPSKQATKRDFDNELDLKL